jgi:hypothetical protein
MPKVSYLLVEGLPHNPVFSEVAVIPSKTSWVLIGGQNAVGRNREIVGKGDALTNPAFLLEVSVEALKP